MKPLRTAKGGSPDETWERSRALSFAQALVQLPYYRLTNPPLAGSARHVIRQVLADRGLDWRDDMGR